MEPNRDGTEPYMDQTDMAETEPENDGTEPLEGSANKFIQTLRYHLHLTGSLQNALQYLQLNYTGKSP